jgi:alpha-galactosidase
LASSTIGAPKQSANNGGGSAFLDLLRTPDYAAAYGSEKMIPLSRSGNGWGASGISFRAEPTSAGLPIVVSAPGLEPTRIHLRWKVQISGDPLILGDAWERSYGELAWRSIVPDRVMPWYFLTYDRGALHGYGVKTQAAALCFWQLDSEGVSLWLDVSNGGSGVQLDDRQLSAATVVTRQGSRNEKPMEAAAAFCRRLCPTPRLAHSPLYGSNDWYYAYGKNSADQTLRDADLVATLSQSNKVRPFTVIDMGWEDGSATFPSMSELARQIKGKQVQPGLWIRPLEAPKDAAPNLLLPSERFGKFAERKRELAFDPTIPEALTLVTQKVKTPVDWGYELIKHDFSTYDLLGKWGREMGPEPTSAGWHLHDRTRTNAEVILALYQALREAAGENALLVGCNTIGHLGAGIFEAQRTGDDTSGKVWERTRRMGVNTVAYRLPQHNTFFAMDPDCVGITSAIPWELNRQWLDLIAKTGAALFISPGPDATGNEQRSAIKEAFAVAASQSAKATPENWFRDLTPESWLVSGNRKRYNWYGNSGCLPFEI